MAGEDTTIEVTLAYGSEGLVVRVPADTYVVTPQHGPALNDEPAAQYKALNEPICGPPLAQLVHPGMRTTVVFPDITRPMPSRDTELVTVLACSGRRRDVLLAIAARVPAPAGADAVRVAVRSAR